MDDSPSFLMPLSMLKSPLQEEVGLHQSVCARPLSGSPEGLGPKKPSSAPRTVGLLRQRQRQLPPGDGRAPSERYAHRPRREQQGLRRPQPLTAAAAAATAPGGCAAAAARTRGEWGEDGDGPCAQRAETPAPGRGGRGCDGERGAASRRRPHPSLLPRSRRSHRRRRRGRRRRDQRLDQLQRVPS